MLAAKRELNLLWGRSPLMCNNIAFSAIRVRRRNGSRTATVRSL